MDYTIIGSGVNLASRLESTAETDQILISHETFALVRDEIDCRELGQISVKGISNPVTTYETIDSYEKSGNSSKLITANHPNLFINLDLETMSHEEKSEALDVLRRALDQVSNSLQKK